MDNKTTEQKFADQITNGVNNSLFNHDEFNKAMSKEHKTLQQNFTRLALKWIEHLAETDLKKTDHRNEASVKTAKKLLDRFKDGETRDLAKDFLPSGNLPHI